MVVVPAAAAAAWVRLAAICAEALVLATLLCVLEARGEEPDGRQGRRLEYLERTEERLVRRYLYSCVSATREEGKGTRTSEACGIKRGDGAQHLLDARAEAAYTGWAVRAEGQPWRGGTASQGAGRSRKTASAFEAGAKRRGRRCDG